MLDLSILDNKYVSSALILFLILYAGLAAPQLPKRVAELFENDMFKLFIMFMIAYMSSKDITVALLVAIGFAISLQTLTKQKINSRLIRLLDPVENNNHIEIENKAKTVTFDENYNINYDSLQDSVEEVEEAEEAEKAEEAEEVEEVKNQNIPNYTSDIGHSINEDNGLGWDSYSGLSSQYSTF